MRLDGGAPLWGRLLWGTFITWLYFRLELAAGCFLFVRRNAFGAVGGFDEEYFASEEVHLSRALKAKGRFVVVPEAVTSSGRKFRLRWAGPGLGLWIRVATGGWAVFKRRHDFWYGRQRERPRADRR